MNNFEAAKPNPFIISYLFFILLGEIYLAASGTPCGNRTHN